MPVSCTRQSRATVSLAFFECFSSESVLHSCVFYAVILTQEGFGDNHAFSKQTEILKKLELFSYPMGFRQSKQTDI